MTDRDVDAAVPQVKSGLWNKPDVYKCDKMLGLPCRECEREEAERRAEYAIAAQRERDAQVCDERARRLRASARLKYASGDVEEGDAYAVAAAVADACAEAIRAARTPQEPSHE